MLLLNSDSHCNVPLTHHPLLLGGVVGQAATLRNSFNFSMAYGIPKEGYFTL